MRYNKTFMVFLDYIGLTYEEYDTEELKVKIESRYMGWYGELSISWGKLPVMNRIDFTTYVRQQILERL